jgi:hypothetical protein
MAKRRKTVLLIIMLCAVVSYSPEIFAVKIIVPWRAKKEIVKQGKNFEIWLKNEPGESIISASLVGPYNTVVLKIRQQGSGLWYYDEYTHASYNYRLSVEVPSGTPEDLYDLVVKSSSGIFISKSSVKVVKEFLSHYYIVHFSDPHVAVSWKDNGNATAPIMQALGETISIIDPALAICTGDNIIGFSRTTDVPKSFGQRWDAFWDGTSSDGLGGMHNARVPVFTMTGNNDYDKFRQNPDPEKRYKLTDWDSLCGMRVFGFSYDQTRFLAFDDYLGELNDHAPFKGQSKDYPEQQKKVLENYLSQAGKGKLRIVLQHAPDRVNTSFCNDNKVELALCGHIHKDGLTTTGTTPTNVFTTAYVCFAEYWSPGYPPPNSAMTKVRIIEIDNNEIVSNQTVNIMDYVHVMKGQDDGKFLTVSFDKPNNGKDTLTTATLTNKIDYSFTGCKIRFVMPKGKYKIDKGTLMQSFDNETMSVYDVKIPIEPNKNISITIQPDHTASDNMKR